MLSLDENPTGLIFEIETGSQSKFRFLAKNLSKSSKRFRYAKKQYVIVRYLLVISVILALTPIPSFLSSLPLYIPLSIYGTSFFVVTLLIAFFFWLLSSNNDKILKSHAVKYSKIEKKGNRKKNS